MSHEYVSNLVYFLVSSCLSPVFCHLFSCVMHPKSETRGSGKNWGHSAVIMEMTDEQTEAL